MNSMELPQENYILRNFSILSPCPGSGCSLPRTAQVLSQNRNRYLLTEKPHKMLFSLSVKAVKTSPDFLYLKVTVPLCPSICFFVFFGEKYFVLWDSHSSALFNLCAVSESNRREGGAAIAIAEPQNWWFLAGRPECWGYQSLLTWGSTKTA